MMDNSICETCIFFDKGKPGMGDPHYCNFHMKEFDGNERECSWYVNKERAINSLAIHLRIAAMES